jgi:DNA-binding response OmpR family regulator
MPYVLCVDDDRGTRDTYRVALRREGYEVTLADSCASARRELSSGGRCDAIFLDLNLPDGTGFELLRGMRERQQFVPTAIVTAFRSEFDPDEAFDLGALAYVDQPLSYDAILALAKSLTRPLSDSDDPTRLHSRVIAGDPGALDCLCSLFMKRLPRRLQAAFPHTSFDLVEDAVGDAAMLYATGSFRRFEPESNQCVVDFVYAIAWRKLANRVHAEKSRRERERRWMAERPEVVSAALEAEHENSFDLWTTIALVVKDARELRAARILVDGGSRDEIANALRCGQLDPETRQRGVKQFRDRLIKRLSRYVREQGTERRNPDR